MYHTHTHLLAHVWGWSWSWSWSWYVTFHKYLLRHFSSSCSIRHTLGPSLPGPDHMLYCMGHGKVCEMTIVKYVEHHHLIRQSEHLNKVNNVWDLLLPGPGPGHCDGVNYSYWSQLNLMHTTISVHGMLSTNNIDIYT